METAEPVEATAEAAEETPEPVETSAPSTEEPAAASDGEGEQKPKAKKTS